MNEFEKIDISGSEVKLNWCKRHLNWTYGITSIIAITFIITSEVAPRFFPGSLNQLMFVLMIPVIIGVGIWVIVQKGRSPWLVAAGLWPFIPAYIVSAQPRYKDFANFEEIASILIAGMIANAIVILFLSNKEHKQIIAEENGKIVKKWSKIDSLPLSPISINGRDLELPFNWFERHVNWTLVITASTIVATISFMVTPIGFFWGPILAIVILTVIVCVITWAILQKGRNMWLVTISLWPVIPAFFLPRVFGSEPCRIGLPNPIENMLIHWFYLMLGMLVNVIAVLLLRNKRHTQIITRKEKGK